MHLRDFQRLFEIVARRNQHRKARAVHRAHRGAGKIGRALLLAHAHAVGDFEIVAVVGGALVRAEEDAGGGDVRRRGEGLGLSVPVGRAFQAHHVEELRGSCACIVAPCRIHCGENVADALALDWAGVDKVDADALGAELQRQFAAPRVHRGLGNDIGGARIVRRAAEDGRDVDDRAAFRDVRRRGARDVPRHAEDIAQRVAHSFAVGAALLLQRGQFLLRQGQVLDRLLGPRAPSVVDQNVDPPKLRHHLSNRRANRGNVPAVERHRGDPRRIGTGRLDQRVRRRLGAVGRAARHHHGCALCKVMRDDMPAQIASRARDDGDFAGEASRGGFSRRSFGVRLGRSHSTLLTKL